MVRDEAAMVKRRVNGELATTATLTHAAITAALSEESAKHFRELTGSLVED